MNFKKYIINFTGDSIKDGIPPGEHHFVSMCLLPILVTAIKAKKKVNKKHDIRKIHYVNPDGMKGKGKGHEKLLCDITYGNIGVEVKYSKNASLSFTTPQLEIFRSIYLKKNKNAVFKGFIAIVNVLGKQDDPTILYISAKDFFETYKKMGRKRFKTDAEFNNKKIWKRIDGVKFRKIFNVG